MQRDTAQHWCDAVTTGNAPVHSLVSLRIDMVSPVRHLRRAGNLLKPMLGRGELRCIGATTIAEYRKCARLLLHLSYCLDKLF